MTKLTKEVKIQIGKETFDELLRTEYDTKVKEQIALKYDISLSMVNKCFSDYKSRIIEPKPTIHDLELLSNYLKKRQTIPSNKKYSEEFIIQVGKEVFEALLDNNYSYDVREDIAKKYNIPVNTINNFLSTYRKRNEEPKPTEEQMKLANNYISLNGRKGVAIPKNIVDILLGATDSELEELLDRYTLKILNNKIEYNKLREPDNKEVYEQVQIRLRNIYNNKTINKSENNQEYSSLELFDKVMSEYLNGIDYYPNYIFVKHNVSKNIFITWIKTIKNNNDIERSNILNKYYDTMKEREVEFSLLVNEVYKLIKNNKATILDFYRLVHMTINRFKSYMKLGIEHNLIPDEEVDVINNFFDLYIVGSYGLANIEEAYKINYEYNGVMLAKEDIKNICLELLKEDIPITKNSIILMFEEKIKNKVNIK